MATGRVGQFDRDRLVGMCESEATGLREYAQYLDRFKGQVADTVNSEARLQEIYQETAPTAAAASVETGTVRAYLIGNDLKKAGRRRVHELEAAAVKIQRSYRAHRIRRRWLQLVSRMVKVGGAGDAETRLVPATLFDSYARSRQLAGEGGSSGSAGRGGAAAAGSVGSRAAPMEERLLTYRRSHELLHGDEFTRW